MTMNPVNIEMEANIRMCLTPASKLPYQRGGVSIKVTTLAFMTMFIMKTKIHTILGKDQATTQRERILASHDMEWKIRDFLSLQLPRIFLAWIPKHKLTSQE